MSIMQRQGHAISLPLDSPDGHGNAAKRLLAKSNFGNFFKLIWGVQSLLQKYFSFVFLEISDYLAPSRLD
jgi:hypothetical protein